MSLSQEMRLCKQLCGRTMIEQLPIVEDGHVQRVFGHQRHIMGNHKYRVSLAVKGAQMFKQRLSIALILPERRLVEQEDALPHNQHRGNAEPPLLSMTEREGVSTRI